MGKPSATARGYDAAWQRLRLVILERDDYRCRWCGRQAGTVDHVVPLAAGGGRLDPANLVAACVGCNSRRGQALSTSRRRTRDAIAPGSGFITATRTRPADFGAGR